jgi:hypothetical protein
MMLGYFKDRKAVSGHPLAAPAEVQTLDECVLAMRRDVWRRLPFDESLGGWHVYGVDACLRARGAGLRCYALPLFVHHDSAAVNLAGLAEAHRRIQRKHAGAEGAIYSTCGVLPTPAGRVREVALRSVRVARAVLRRPPNDFLSVVQGLADGVERMVVLDFFAGAGSPGWPVEVAAEALDGKARTSRAVLHRIVVADEPPAELAAWLGRELPAPLMLMNLPDAAPGALDALGEVMARGAREVWAVYPRPQRDAVRALAGARGWDLLKERRTIPYMGPGPRFVSELRPRAARRASLPQRQ